MLHVYIDPSAIAVLSPTGAAAGDSVVHGAAEPLNHLVEAGWTVVLVGDDGVPAEELPDGVEVGGALPDRIEPGEWFLTGEPYPTVGRPRGGRTVLVGPRRPPGRIPLPRFDLEARDLGSAVMEILTRQAMA